MAATVPNDGDMKPHRLGLLLLPQFSFLALGAVLDPLFILNWLTQSHRFEWHLLSVDGAPVTASNGLPVATESALPPPDMLDSIFVLASFEIKTYTDDVTIRRWLRHCARAGIEIGGIEMGVEVLASAGLLEEQRVAVHWDNLAGFTERYPGARATTDLYTLIPGRLLTCAGGSAVLDAILAWVEPLVERDYLDELRNHLIEPRRRAPSVDQLPAAPEHHVDTSAQIRQAIRLMRQSMESPLSVAALAYHVGLSERQFLRRFRADIGITPLRYYRWLRVNLAHRLLQQTDLSVTEIANCSGFGSLEHFSRVYRRYFACAPHEDRIQSSSAPVLPVRYLPRR